MFVIRGTTALERHLRRVPCSAIPLPSGRRPRVVSHHCRPTAEHPGQACSVVSVARDAIAVCRASRRPYVSPTPLYSAARVSLCHPRFKLICSPYGSHRLGRALPGPCWLVRRPSGCPCGGHAARLRRSVLGAALWPVDWREPQEVRESRILLQGVNRVSSGTGVFGCRRSAGAHSRGHSHSMAVLLCQYLSFSQYQHLQSSPHAPRATGNIHSLAHFLSLAPSAPVPCARNPDDRNARAMQSSHHTATIPLPARLRPAALMIQHFEH